MSGSLIANDWAALSASPSWSKCLRGLWLSEPPGFCSAAAAAAARMGIPGGTVEARETVVAVGGLGMVVRARPARVCLRIECGKGGCQCTDVDRKAEGCKY